MTDHPITPPPELVQQWCDPRVTKSMHFSEEDLATRAAQWGADVELEACCEWMRSQNLDSFNDRIASFRTARRPKPPSLKKQALAELAEWERICDIAPDSPIRLALEQLDD